MPTLCASGRSLLAVFFGLFLRQDQNQVFQCNQGRNQNNHSFDQPEHEGFSSVHAGCAGNDGNCPGQFGDNPSIVLDGFPPVFDLLDYALGATFQYA